MNTATLVDVVLPVRAPVTAVVPVVPSPVVVRTTGSDTYPYEAGYYTDKDHKWSLCLPFTGPAEAVVYAAAVNRRSGRWSA